jgi:hypothetical protein
MKTSWQSETRSLECRWFEAGQAVQRVGPQIEGASESRDRSFLPSIPDFASHSPLGSGEWFAPWSQRWSLPRRP